MSTLYKCKFTGRYLAVPVVGALLACLYPPISAATVGNPLTPELQLEKLPYQTPFAAVASDGSGNMLVLWAQAPNGVDSPWAVAKYSATGSSLLEPTSIAGTNSQSINLPLSQRSIAADAAGDFVITFGCNTLNSANQVIPRICIQIFSSTGQATTDAITVAEIPAVINGAITNTQFYGVKASMSSRGDIVVGWSDSFTYGRQSGPVALAVRNRVFTQRYTLDGKALGSATLIASETTPLNLGGKGTPVTGLSTNSSGAYAISWSATGYRFKAQIFDATGKASSSIITLPSSLTPSYQNRGSVYVSDTLALTLSGDMIVGWEALNTAASPTSEDVYMGRYSAQGTLKGSVKKVLTRRPVNGHGTGGLSLTPRSNDGFWLTWGEFSTNDQLTVNRTLMAQAFDSSNSVVGAPFTVGNDTYDFRSADTNDLYPFVLSTVDQSDNLFAVWGSISARLFEGP